MSVKRRAANDLNHENWDQEDPVEQEETGTIQIASKDVLEKRVMKTARRRTPAAGDEPKKSTFSGFGGFNKTQPASFDFLSKLTNGSNESTGSASKMDSSVTSSLFTSKPLASSPGSGLFSQQNASTPSKSPFGSPSTLTGTSTLFGVSSTNATTTPNMFTSKADSTVTSTTDTKMDSAKSTTTSANIAKSIFSSTSNATAFKLPTVTNTVQSNSGTITKSETNSSNAGKNSDEKDSKMKYYSKLKGLNESVSDWIKKHVDQTPLCILTPIFKDYEKYLKQIQDEYKDSENKDVDMKPDDKVSSDKKTDSEGTSAKTTTLFSPKTTGSTLFNASPSSKSIFTPPNSNASPPTEKAPTFSFGIKAATTASSMTTTSSPGFTFGIATTTSQATPTTSSPFALGTSSSPFSFASNTTTAAATNGAAPFSFGNGKPFSFTNVKQNTETTEEANKEEDEDTPPKVEYTPVVEDNSVYDIKCKIFVKKDGNFVDKGVGTLYIKKVEESGKHQLLVRANTNLGTILVNLILVSAIPTQRMGKNNVMMVCIPTPDSKPPPTPILIRVKTSDEADDLLATLNKYKS